MECVLAEVVDVWKTAESLLVGDGVISRRWSPFCKGTSDTLKERGDDATDAWLESSIGRGDCALGLVAGGDGSDDV
jgi:hypothetical protein